MYLVPGISWKRSPTRNGLTVRGLIYFDIECYRRTAAVCVDIRYSISTPYCQVYDTTWLNFTKMCTLLECTWYLVFLVETELDTKWVDRG